MARLIVQKIMVLTWLLFAAQAGAVDLREELMNAPPEKQLAFLNASNRSWTKLDPVVVARFRSLLNQLNERYSENDHQIADWTVQMQEALETYGIKESLLNLMEGMNSASLGVRLDSKRSYHDDLTNYAVLRNKGWTHKEAIKGTKQFIEGLRPREP